MEIDHIFGHLRTWWGTVAADLEVGELYVFGSTIYQGGKLFDPAQSDLDIVTIIPDSLTNAVQRSQWLESLARHKQSLELDLVRLLKRKDSSKSIVSLTPITQLELRADLHKSKVRGFFSSNEFFDLNAIKPLVGLSDANTAPIENDLVRQVIEHCQGLRNKFLGVSAIADKYPLEWKSTDDPLPKELMRNAALTASVGLPHSSFEERFDIRVGLDSLNSYVFARRADDSRYRKAYEWITVRRGGRGNKANAQALSHEMHLFLGEVLFDLSAATISTPALPPAAGGTSSSVASTTAVLNLRQDVADPVEFSVGRDGLLRGDSEDLQASLAEATLNIKWRRQPYFTLTSEELQAIDERLATLTGRDAASRKSRTEAVDRQLRLRGTMSAILLGFQLLLYYQYRLFPDAATRSDDLLLAMSSYSLLCTQPEVAAEHFGGPLEAYPEPLWTEPIVRKIGFGVPELDLDEFFVRAFGAVPEDGGLTTLAAQNQPLSGFRQSVLAAHFTPLLVKAIVDSRTLGDDVVKSADDAIEATCDLLAWKVGVH